MQFALFMKELTTILDYGMFVNNEFRSMFLNKIGLKSSNLDYKKEVNKSIDDFADLIEDNINVSKGDRELTSEINQLDLLIRSGDFIKNLKKKKYLE